MNTTVATLREWMARRIAASGAIPFAEFMAAALTHEAFGYYTRPDATTGPRGDFFTSPDVHPAFGLLVSRQVAEIADRAVEETASFEIVEMGPGSGRLARDLAAGLAAENPRLAARTHVTLVDVSPSLREAQRRLLSEPASGGPPPASRLRGVSWESWESLRERAGRGAFTGCVVANEFLDALPVHVLERQAGRILEVHVTSGPDGIEEVLLPPSTPRLTEHLDDLARRHGVTLEEGQRAEIGLAGLDWVAQLGDLLGGEGRGGALLIDYGYPVRELYGSHRHRGTLLAYRRHRVVEDLYEHAGEQDMTAHVDFSSVADRARQSGLDVAPLTTQMRFLLSLGLASMLSGRGTGASPASEEVRDRLAMHALMAPGGMGEIFKVMLLTRGTEAAALTGARDPFADLPSLSGVMPARPAGAVA